MDGELRVFFFSVLPRLMSSLLHLCLRRRIAVRKTCRRHFLLLFVWERGGKGKGYLFKRERRRDGGGLHLGRGSLFGLGSRDFRLLHFLTGYMLRASTLEWTRLATLGFMGLLWRKDMDENSSLCFFFYTDKYTRAATGGNLCTNIIVFFCINIGVSNFNCRSPAGIISAVRLSVSAS